MQTIHITLPRDWNELTQEQFLYLCTLLSLPLSKDQMRAYAVCRLSKADEIQIKDKLSLQMFAGMLAPFMNNADWIFTIPAYPVRIEAGAKYDPLLHGLSFETYLTLDNLYQGFIYTQKTELLLQMAMHLYDPVPEMNKDKVEAQHVNILLWWASFKQNLSNTFTDLFRSEEPTLTQPTRKGLQAAIDWQLLTLTAGDITKEEHVMQTDVWRAMTYLNNRAQQQTNPKKKNLLL
jgi:hypothetical protein